MFNRERARFRYRIAFSLLIYGLVALAAFIPLALWTWGGPSARWVIGYLMSGLLALGAATGLGIVNMRYLRRNPDHSQLIGTFE